MIPVPSLPEEEIAELRNTFETQLRATYREGVEELLEWLETETDFFEAPASASKHGAIAGGLLKHSVFVLKYLRNFIKPLGDAIPDDSVVIVALLHDLCKANFYTIRTKNVKVGDRQWEEQEYYAIEDQLPLGHGEKSAMLAQRFLELTDDELLAIRWHMGGFDDAARQYAGGQALANAFDRCKLAVATNVADMYVANIIGY
ncbi:MAG: HD domain-containing protein [Christensenellales bacterium]|jgi:hypothetical protein